MIKNDKMGTIKINIFKKKSLILLIGIFIAIFICINLVSATLVPAPSIYAWEGGRVIVVDKDLNTFIPTGDFVAEGGYIDKNGTKVFWRTITPAGVILEEEGESPAPDSYDYDVQVYIPKVADPKDVGFSAPNKPFDPNIGWWITSTAREMGPAISNLGLNFITLGWYNVYQQYEYYSDSKNLPATWGETGLEMLDNVPVAGSIKAAVESEGWDRAGYVSTAVGSGILWGVGATAKFAPETYAKMGSIKLPPGRKIFYVDRQGVTIPSRFGAPSRFSFVKKITDKNRLLPEVSSFEQKYPEAYVPILGKDLGRYVDSHHFTDGTFYFDNIYAYILDPGISGVSLVTHHLETSSIRHIPVTIEKALVRDFIRFPKGWKKIRIRELKSVLHQHPGRVKIAIGRFSEFMRFNRGFGSVMGDQLIDSMKEVVLWDPNDY